MARPKKLENMSVAELAEMQANIERMKMDKHNAERAVAREKIISIAKEHGFVAATIQRGIRPRPVHVFPAFDT